MPEQAAGERTEEATPKRRREARRRGMVARSPELSSAVTFLAFVLLFPLLGSALVQALLDCARTSIASAQPAPVTVGEIASRILPAVGPVLVALAPLMLIGVTFGVTINLLQVGFVVSGEPLNPQFDRLNPISGLKRMFSMRAGVEGLKAVVKTGLIGYVAFTTIRGQMDVLQGIGSLEPMVAVSVVAGIVSSVLLRVGVLWLILAVFDYWFQRKQMDKQLMMTKDEVKRELREMEQGPELKMAMARRRAQLARQRMMQAVKTADAVVTNPTHYAVALKYEALSMSAPQVVAKGLDLMALRIRDDARKWGVPVIPNPPLAQSLYKLCEVGDTVPSSLFEAVAEVIAYVMNRTRRRRTA
ncbi:MAG: flagellar biosynthetic protein FlhB [Fimbriimonadales bacterium]